MNNVYVYLADLPPHIREIVTPCFDGYTVYIDAGLSQDEQEDAYSHALAHIEAGDFEKESGVQEIEFDRHNAENRRAG